MIATITLNHSTTSIKQARTFVADHLDGQEDQLVADATLMVSELVTNAIRHGTGPCELTIEVTAVAMRVDVRDAGAALPVLRSPSPDDAFGRGLGIVADLADDWGIESTPGIGNNVWFSLRLHIAHVAGQLPSDIVEDVSPRPQARGTTLDPVASDDDATDGEGHAGSTARPVPHASPIEGSSQPRTCRPGRHGRRSTYDSIRTAMARPSAFRRTRRVARSSSATSNRRH